MRRYLMLSILGAMLGLSACDSLTDSATTSVAASTPATKVDSSAVGSWIVITANGVTDSTASNGLMIAGDGTGYFINKGVKEVSFKWAANKITTTGVPSNIVEMNFVVVSGQLILTRTDGLVLVMTKGTPKVPTVVKADTTKSTDTTKTPATSSRIGLWRSITIDGSTDTTATLVFSTEFVGLLSDPGVQDYSAFQLAGSSFLASTTYSGTFKISGDTLTLVSNETFVFVKKSTTPVKVDTVKPIDTAKVPTDTGSTSALYPADRVGSWIVTTVAGMSYPDTTSGMIFLAQGRGYFINAGVKGGEITWTASTLTDETSQALPYTVSNGVLTITTPEGDIVLKKVSSTYFN